MHLRNLVEVHLAGKKCGDVLAWNRVRFPKSLEFGFNAVGR
jgi:hypothetical protein